MEHFNINCIVDYNNDDEYRECLQQIFCMKIYSALENDTTIIGRKSENIDETEDKIDFAAMDSGLEFIFSMTKDNDLFKILYEKYAASVMSIEPLIGLTVLFAYENLQLFYPCFLDFYYDKTIRNSLFSDAKDTEGFTATNKFYKQLIENIEKRVE